ncbi:MAG: hypothetical protein QOG28_1305 [Trebonia sp.]|nr:hypothetical protein [Trebonia sp.]
MRGHPGDGKVSSVGVGVQIGALEHCCESDAKEVEPLIEAGGRVIENVLVGFQQLARRFGAILSADQVQALKPRREAYDRAADGVLTAGAGTVRQLPLALIGDESYRQAVQQTRRQPGEHP